MQKVLRTKPCFHGGAVYKIIGDDFSDLNRQKDVIDADVLDAWFEPSPKAVQALRDNLVWSLRSSPPVAPTGVERAISKSIDVATANILCGAGSSNLIFLALRELLTTKSKVLILDPTYGEYSFLISQVIGCQLDSFQLSAENNYKINLDSLVAKMNSEKYDLVILVNPNNPSGQFVCKENLIDALNLIPKSTHIWIDEAYIDYVDKSQSLSNYASKSNNAIVCKSLSKVLALSGLRVAYIVANKAIIDRLRLLTPPWSLSLPAQIVLLEAIQDSQYYSECYAITLANRIKLSEDLRHIGFLPRESTANFVLVDYPNTLPSVDGFLSKCSEKLLLLRNIKSMGKETSDYCFRVAVKGSETNHRMIKILSDLKNSLSTP